MTFNPEYLTTLIGSFPYTDTAEACNRSVRAIDIATWPQMVKKNFLENMYTQFAAVLPGIVIDEVNQKISFDTARDLTPEFERFYAPYLEENVDYFALPREHAEGFYAVIDLIKAGETREQAAPWIKGQVTGPFSMGLTIADQNSRASLYNEMLADALVKNAAMNARWQVRKLKSARGDAIVFVDEPYLASFGSAFVNLGRAEVVSMLDEVFQAIHTEGGLAGVHCCANTDWSVLLATAVDILSLDAYGFIENLALYPEELRGFLDRGGVVAWGIVPNDEEINSVTAESLVRRLREGIAAICQKAVTRGVGIRPQEFDARSLLTPACGLGSATVELSDKVLEVLAETARILRAE
ncbi:MAG: hypothetical protein JXA30_19325 [Deltaproteobacteria bacterium]|nr:hypothetical protein [Deltaproteobacteria bacterium]